MSAVLVPDDWEKDLPQPLFWRVLVRPKIAREMSKGGIALASLPTPTSVCVVSITDPRLAIG